MQKKWLLLVTLLLIVGTAFTGGYWTRSAVAQEKLSSAPKAESLPPDILPETLARIGWATRDEFTTPEDLAAYDHAVSLMPQLAKHSYAGPTKTCTETVTCIDGNGIRLHIPVVHTAYRDIIQNLNQKNGLDAVVNGRYTQLATLVSCRENDVEPDWLAHEKNSMKVLPREIVEIVRNNKDTTGLEEKDAVLIRFGRELFRQSKVSSKTFADMQRLFGTRGTLAVTLIMAHYDDNAILYRVYDQRMGSEDPRPFPDIVAKEAKQPS